MPEQSIRR
jgi:type I restriction enzyme R subunit